MYVCIFLPYHRKSILVPRITDTMGTLGKELNGLVGPVQKSGLAGCKRLLKCEFSEVLYCLAKKAESNSLTRVRLADIFS
jgi:hypothetical protein